MLPTLPNVTEEFNYLTFLGWQVVAFTGSAVFCSEDCRKKTLPWADHLVWRIVK